MPFASNLLHILFSNITHYSVRNSSFTAPITAPMKIRFQLIESKQDAKGLCPVFLRYFYAGSDLRYFTGEKCKSTEWDIDKMKFKRSHEGWQNANERLSKLRSDLESAAHNFKLQRIIPTPQQLKECIAPQSSKIESIVIETMVKVYDDFLEWGTTNGKKPGTVKSLRTTRNHLNKFIVNYPVKVDEFTITAYDAFITWMMSKFDYQPNYIGNQTKNLITFFHWCQKVKKINLSPDHAHMTVDKLLVDKIFLTIEEIERMREVALPDYLARIRDVFLFGCYTGLRYSDLNKLSDLNIADSKGIKVLSFVPQKTNSFYQKSRKKIEVALIPQAIEIIERYKETHVKVLPIISNQKMNQYLKVIGEKAQINNLVEVFTYVRNESVCKEVEKYKLITCHSARHTFATQSLSRGVPIEVIQQLMGHSDIKTTQIYAKLVDEYKHTALLNAWKK